MSEWYQHYVGWPPTTSRIFRFTLPVGIRRALFLRGKNDSDSYDDGIDDDNNNNESANVIIAHTLHLLICSSAM